MAGDQNHRVMPAGPPRIAPRRLEAQIAAKLRSIARGAEHFETRILHSGAFRYSPLRLHARRRLRRSGAQGYSLDAGAHLFSRLQQALPAGFFQRVQDILFLPELAATTEHLLTHVYSPRSSALAFYLYPLSLDQSCLKLSGRLPPSPLGGAGLAGAVLHELSHQQPADAALRSFVVARSLLDAAEVQALEASHHRYLIRDYAE